MSQALIPINHSALLAILQSDQRLDLITEEVDQLTDSFPEFLQRMQEHVAAITDQNQKLQEQIVQLESQHRQLTATHPAELSAIQQRIDGAAQEILGLRNQMAKEAESASKVLAQEIATREAATKAEIVKRQQEVANLRKELELATNAAVATARQEEKTLAATSITQARLQEVAKADTRVAAARQEEKALAAANIAQMQKQEIAKADARVAAARQEEKMSAASVLAKVQQQLATAQTTFAQEKQRFAQVQIHTVQAAERRITEQYTQKMQKARRELEDEKNKLLQEEPWIRSQGNLYNKRIIQPLEKVIQNLNRL